MIFYLSDKIDILAIYFPFFSDWFSNCDLTFLFYRFCCGEYGTQRYVNAHNQCIITAHVIPIVFSSHLYSYFSALKIIREEYAGYVWLKLILFFFCNIIVSCICISWYIIQFTWKYFYFNSSVSGKTEEGETEESLHVSKAICSTVVMWESWLQRCLSRWLDQ